MLVLSYFSEKAKRTKGSCGLRKKEVAQEGETLMKHMLQLGKWPFNSGSSHKTLLNCVLDPTDDIRETAGLILMTYFSFKEPDTKENKPLLDYALRLCTSPMFYETESGALLMKVLGNWTYKMPPKKSDELISSMVSMKCNKSLTRNRSHSSNLVLHNQQKLLVGLHNKPNRSVHNKVESREDIIVEIKKNVGTLEGTLHVMHPSLLKVVFGIEVPQERQIFENMAVVARDGLVGQSFTSGTDKSHCLSEKQTYSGVDSSNNTINVYKQKSLSYNTKNGRETICDLWDSHASLKDGVEYFCGESRISSQQYQLHPPWPDSSISKGDHFALEDLSEVWHTSASEVTSSQSSDHTQSILEGQVEQDSWNRQVAKEQEADYQISSRSFTLPGRQRFSRKRKKLKNLHKNKQVEVALSLRSHKSESLIVKHSTKDETHNNPFMNKKRDFKDSSVRNSWNAYSSASSSSGYETTKFQQPRCFESSVITDADFPPFRAGSGGRQHDIGIDCRQKSKQFDVPQFRFQRHSIPKGFCAYKEQNMKPGDWELFPYEDWGLNESPEKKNVHKCESNVGTCRYLHPSKNNPKEMGSANVIPTYNGSAPLSVFLLTQAEAQLTSLKGDIFQAASSGSPLHGTITALIRLTTQPDGPECGCMSAEEVNRTVTLLEQTVSFFLDLLAAKSAATAGNPFLYILVSQIICFFENFLCIYYVTMCSTCLFHYNLLEFHHPKETKLFVM
jgi:hypothetical protein